MLAFIVITWMVVGCLSEVITSKIEKTPYSSLDLLIGAFLGVIALVINILSTIELLVERKRNKNINQKQKSDDKN